MLNRNISIRLKILNSNKTISHEKCHFRWQKKNSLLIVVFLNSTTTGYVINTVQFLVRFYDPRAKCFHDKMEIIETKFSHKECKQRKIAGSNY